MKYPDELTEKIIGCCFKVHKELGPGFNERIYHNALIVEFEKQGIKHKTEKEYEIKYFDDKVGRLRIDLVVEDKVIVELKALTGSIPQVFEYQVISYLKSSGLNTGLLINFGNKSCQIKRLVY